MRTLTYAVAVSLDGFVCAPDGSFDFFPGGQEIGDTGEYIFGEFPELTPTHVREHFGIQAPTNTSTRCCKGEAPTRWPWTQGSPVPTHTCANTSSRALSRTMWTHT